MGVLLQSGPVPDCVIAILNPPAESLDEEPTRINARRPAAFELPPTVKLMDRDPTAFWPLETSGTTHDVVSGSTTTL